MKEVNLNDENYRLVFDKVGFWIDANNNYYLANPTDVEYLRNRYGVKTVSGKVLNQVGEEMHQLWNKRIVPILEVVFKSNYVPCSEKPASTCYWDCAKTPYFGVNILHSDKFIGQHWCIFEQSKEEFVSEMQRYRWPWAVQEIETNLFHFVGDANSNWQILLK